MINIYIYRATVGRNLGKIPSGGEVTPFGDVTLAYAHVKMHNRFAFFNVLLCKAKNFSQRTLSLIPGDASASVGATDWDPAPLPLGAISPPDANPAASISAHRLLRIASPSPCRGSAALGFFWSGLFTGVKDVGGGGLTNSTFSDFTKLGPVKLVFFLGGTAIVGTARAGVATGFAP